MEEKERGNEFFKNGNFAAAERCYSKAISILLKRIPTPTPDSQVDSPNYIRYDDDADFEALNSLLVQAYGNRAQSRIFLGKLRESVQDCDQVLSRDERNWKALMRKSRAFEEMHDFHKAYDAVSQVLRLCTLANEKVPQSMRLRAQAKISELCKLKRCFVPPSLNISERKGMLNRNQTIRLSIRSCSIPQSVYVYTKCKTNETFATVGLYLSNEFGLYDNSVEHPVGIECSTRILYENNEYNKNEHDNVISCSFIDSSGALKPCLEVDSHGRASSRIKLTVNNHVPTGGIKFQIRFSMKATQHMTIMPVLSLPIVVNDYDSIKQKNNQQEQLGLSEYSYSYCREISLTKKRQLYILVASGDLGIAGRLWDSATVLLGYFASHPNIIRGKSLVELGAGTGAVGLGCAVLGCDRAIVTDLAPVLPLIEKNVMLNRDSLSNSQVLVNECCWGVTKSDWSTVDMVIMSDTVYDPQGYVPLITTLKEICAVNPLCCIYWSHRHRNPEDYRFFQMFSREFSTRLVQGVGPNFVNEEPVDSLSDLAKMFGRRDSKLADIDNNHFSSQDVSIYCSQPI
mmetsp:Transcript_9045/g.11773  ORF Transcript_9045/g.11773 Transcript_9045/m.11773 type:complete len:570 (-) Transcript_9045:1176-2885(-)